MTQDANPTDEETIGLQKIMARAVLGFAPLLMSAMVFMRWMDRAWWVVQEFCMCPNTVFARGAKIVVTKLVNLGLHILMAAAGNMSRAEFRALAPPGVPRERMRDLEDEPLMMLFSCRSKRQKCTSGQPGATGDRLHELLQKLFVGRGTKVTYAQDRIHGLLGLVVDGADLGIGPPEDYKSNDGSNIKTLTRAARALIEIGGRIDTLCYSQFPRERELDGLPSCGHPTGAPTSDLPFAP